MAVTPVHRLAHQRERPDGGAERFHADHDAYRSPEGLGGAYQHPNAIADADIDAYITRLLLPEERPDELNREILRLWEADR